MLRMHIPRSLVNMHRIALIAALQQQGVAPETYDFLFMCRPFSHMGGKDRCQGRLPPDRAVKLRYDAVDLSFGNRNAGRHCHTAKIQTKMRLRIR